MLPNITHIVVMRLLIRHGFSRDMADLLLEDFKRAIMYLQKHAPTTPLTAGEATSFTHDALPLEKLPAGAPANAKATA